MPKEFKAGCQRPEIKTPMVQELVDEVGTQKKKEEMHMVKVGKPAPEFTAPAYYQGKFVTVDLSEYRGKWVVLCFYPGDFTFV
jgi:peroxiredoxin (alkyl hydroperoxide reductase subunit C)